MYMGTNEMKIHNYISNIQNQNTSIFQAKLRTPDNYSVYTGVCSLISTVNIIDYNRNCKQPAFVTGGIGNITLIGKFNTDFNKDMRLCDRTLIIFIFHHAI